jgi:hypothetical protein
MKGMTGPKANLVRCIEGAFSAPENPRYNMHPIYIAQLDHFHQAGKI